MRRIPLESALLAAALALSGGAPSFAAAGAPGTVEKPKARAEASRPAPAALEWTSILKLGLAALVVAGASAGLVWAQRRLAARGEGASAAGGLRLAGRVALSPKHFACLLKLGEREVVVGVSPDRLTTLAVFDREGAAPGGRPEAPSRERPADKPPEAASGGGLRRVAEGDLLPYRRQVERLRGLLRPEAASRAAEGDVP